MKIHACFLILCTFISIYIEPCDFTLVNQFNLKREQIFEEKNKCKNGLKSGNWQYYYPNSDTAVFLEGRYREGFRVGVWKIFFRDGTLFKKGKYLTKYAQECPEKITDGISVDVFKPRLHSSKVQNKEINEFNPGAMINERGKPHLRKGRWLTYSKSGKRIRIQFYDEGKLIRKN